MRIKLLLNNIGKILIVMALFLLLPTIYSVIKNDGMLFPFLATSAGTAVIGFTLLLFKRKKESLTPVECLVLVAISWITISIIGAFPFFLSGWVPNFIDALFESTSGFTTTGSTILNDIEALPQSLLLWRSFSQWIGGLGIVVFILALIPDANGSAYNIIKAESSRKNVSNIIKKLSKTSKILFLIYAFLTLILYGVLLLCGLDSFNSACIAFSTAGTGGFAPLNDSIAGYGNIAVEIVVTIFMLIFSINFALFYLILLGKIGKAIKNEEFLWYIAIVIITIIAVTLNIMSLTGNFWTAFKDASFEVISYISSTGFVITDVNLWPVLSHILLFVIVFIGGCSGSTAGGIKVYRFAIMGKVLIRRRQGIAELNSYRPVRYNGETLDNETISKTLAYILTYIMIFVLFAIIYAAIENINFTTTMSVSISTLSNIGVGLDQIEGFSNYNLFSYPTKMIIILEMLLGRLEILPLVALFLKRTWK